MRIDSTMYKGIIMIQDLYKLEEHLRIARLHLDEASEIFDILMDFVTEESCEEVDLEKY